MHKNLIHLVFILLVTITLSACSTNAFNDLFQNYNQQMHQVRQAQQQGDFQQAISLIPPRSISDSNYTLYLLEKARLAFLANDTTQSQEVFAMAYELIEQAQQGAKIQLSRSVENIAAVMSNDNSLRYDVELYEQSLLHSFQALNYLAQKNLSAALVEVRRANLVQEEALITNAKSINKHQEKMASQGVNLDNLNSQYPSMNNVIGNIKNGFQNAYTFYLSGLLYEMAGQNNDAYIDYKKALEITPNNHYLQQDVWRLANKLSMTDDIAILKSRIVDTITNKNNDENQGHVIFIVENGIVASKQEIAINLPIYTRQGNMRFYSVALPSYQNYLTKYTPLSVNYQGQYYESEELVRVQSLAAKQLTDQLPEIITRQIIRLLAKEELRQQLARNNGELGSIFASIYNMATEKADTRSWSTLPDSIHVLRLAIPAGEQQLMLNINGQNQQINVSIKPNKITLVKLTAIGGYNHYQTYN